MTTNIATEVQYVAYLDENYAQQGKGETAEEAIDSLLRMFLIEHLTNRFGVPVAKFALQLNTSYIIRDEYANEPIVVTLIHRACDSASRYATRDVTKKLLVALIDESLKGVAGKKSTDWDTVDINGRDFAALHAKLGPMVDEWAAETYRQPKSFTPINTEEVSTTVGELAKQVWPP